MIYIHISASAAATPASVEAAFTARDSSSWTLFLVSVTNSKLSCVPATGRIRLLTELCFRRWWKSEYLVLLVVYTMAVPITRIFR